ncbi:SPOR domain-containing protein [Acinetobacter stercoris]|uniref:Sporulation related domain protein n=1 Tax=Acinetobacter stercoris TaxID=2126983 RepID=A0A2U3N1P3_9GAMM|nr:SPOR domain-containing protein [Acinetobacter stercoris]SPL71600.1 Sporulation related domain protein [Acinetobacter stercoris]
MSMNNKQRWMGGVVLLGGGVLLAALLLKGNEEIHQKQSVEHTAEDVQQNQSGAQPSLTVDVATEKRLLEEQKRAREKAVAEQEAKAAEFLRLQQQAEAAAAQKAAEEYAARNARRLAAQESSDNIPPADLTAKSKQDENKANTQSAKVTDAEKKLAEQQKQRQAQAEADKKAAEAKRKAEEAKKKADAQAKAQAQAEEERKQAAAKKKAEADRKAEAEKKQKAEEARKKAEAEKARDLLENGDKQWMVQVALAANQANADAVASKLRAKGYKVTKSPTSKGIRIMVGPSKDRAAADATRKKITSDESLGMKSAWVIDWVPLDQR